MRKKQANRNAGKHKQASTKTSAPSEGNLSLTRSHQVTEDSDKQDTTSTTSRTVNTHNEVIGLYNYVYKLSKTGRQYVLKKLPLIIPSIILLLLGFKQWPQNIPILNFASEHRVASPIIGGGLSLLFLGGMIISYLPEPNHNNNGKTPKNGSHWRIRPWAVATGLSTTSFVLSTSLLVIVLIRPGWCPNALCFTPQPLIYGPHDANLEVDFTALQSPAYVLTKDPAQYSLKSKNLPGSDDPSSIGVFRIDEKNSSPYLVAMNIHNLRSEGFTMIIEDVALIVKPPSPIPHPLNIWNQPPSHVYQGENLYNIIYRGQDTNSTLSSTYVHLPGAYVQLKPIETDSIAMQVTAHLKAATDLRFSVQITYRFANESHRYTFTPPYVFDVIFAKASNWNPYHLQAGQLQKG